MGDDRKWSAVGRTDAIDPEQKSQTKTARTSDTGHQPTNPEVRSSNLFGRATPDDDGLYAIAL
ncbi:hypothetical protein CQ10_33465 [Bradyrhizobium valentinum]|uniref:Uncharacterized protein n=1 Tax=Bradyrhizobium valentinum TaxID=1518501 RepID=A0A0R3KQ19_9BRAD|nr:hypothetical protein CQ10_33465 [Bradyrhizobium valentinum]KRQ99207.1 hypothetical protein CP49_11425 [Bradyrhizobium valentinum]